MATVTPTELHEQTARVLARARAGEQVTIADEGGPIARLTPKGPARRVARPASEVGVPTIQSPIRDWSTEQMLEDMRGA